MAGWNASIACRLGLRKGLTVGLAGGWTVVDGPRCPLLEASCDAMESILRSDSGITKNDSLLEASRDATALRKVVQNGLRTGGRTNGQTDGHDTAEAQGSRIGRQKGIIAWGFAFRMGHFGARGWRSRKVVKKRLFQVVIRVQNGRPDDCT